VKFFIKNQFEIKRILKKLIDIEKESRTYIYKWLFSKKKTKQPIRKKIKHSNSRKFKTTYWSSKLQNEEADHITEKIMRNSHYQDTF
jgi:predicted transcriptional regulator